MKRVILFASLMTIPVGAFAQVPAPAPAFVPITVTQADLQELDNAFVNNPPRSYENVVSQWIRGLEVRAQTDARAKDAKTSPPTKPVKPVEPPKDKK